MWTILGAALMDPFRLTLALGPAAIYLLLLGMINLSRRPLLVSGGRDAAALALAITGMLIVGPFELFLPQASVMRYGPYVWVMVLTFYGLSIAMGILMLRPRLVIYNISADKLRPILAEVVASLDSDARWAGDSLVLPNLAVQLSIDNFRTMRNVSLKSVSGNQDLHGWRRLEQGLAGALSQETVSRSPRGLVLIFAGLLILGGLAMVIYRDPQAITQSIFDLTETVLRMLNL
ncbi:MAG: hypothetical protein ABSA26_06810 [Thermoguttaceae bacterium]|jgi:hypothetical protein